MSRLHRKAGAGDTLAAIQAEINAAFAALDEEPYPAARESGGIELGLAGRIRMLRFQLGTEANRLRSERDRLKKAATAGRAFYNLRFAKDAAWERAGEKLVAALREAGLIKRGASS